MPTHPLFDNYLDADAKKKEKPPGRESEAYQPTFKPLGDTSRPLKDPKAYVPLTPVFLGFALCALTVGAATYGNHGLIAVAVVLPFFCVFLFLAFAAAEDVCHRFRSKK